MQSALVPSCTTDLLVKPDLWSQIKQCPQMWPFAPFDKEDKIMSSGSEAFWHCRVKSPPGNESFLAAHLSVSDGIYARGKSK